MIKILSTLPHYITLLYVPDLVYGSVVFISSTFSIIWHYNNEPYGFLFYMDYLFALFWMICELMYTKHILIVTSLNLTVFLLNKITDKLSPYNTWHSAWHIISVVKSILVAKYFSS